MNKKILEAFERKLLQSNNAKEALKKMTPEEIQALASTLAELDTEEVPIKHLQKAVSAE